MKSLIFLAILISYFVFQICHCIDEKNWHILNLLKKERDISLSNAVTLQLNSTTNYSKLFLSAKTLFPDNILPDIFILTFKLKFLNRLKSAGTILSFTDPDNVKRLSLTLKASPGAVDQFTLNIIFHPLNGDRTVQDFVLPFQKFTIWTFALAIKSSKIILYTSCDDTKRDLGFEFVNIKPTQKRNFFKDGAILNLFHESDGKNKLKGEVFEVGFANYEEMLQIVCTIPMIEGSGNKIAIKENEKIGNVVLIPDEEKEDLVDNLKEIINNTLAKNVSRNGNITLASSLNSTLNHNNSYNELLKEIMTEANNTLSDKGEEQIINGSTIKADVQGTQSKTPYARKEFATRDNQISPLTDKTMEIPATSNIYLTFPSKDMKKSQVINRVVSKSPLKSDEMTNYPNPTTMKPTPLMCDGTYVKPLSSTNSNKRTVPIVVFSKSEFIASKTDKSIESIESTSPLKTDEMTYYPTTTTMIPTPKPSDTSYETIRPATRIKPSLSTDSEIKTVQTISFLDTESVTSKTAVKNDEDIKIKTSEGGKISMLRNTIPIIENFEHTSIKRQSISKSIEQFSKFSKFKNDLLTIIYNKQNFLSEVVTTKPAKITTESIRETSTNEVTTKKSIVKTSSVPEAPNKMNRNASGLRSAGVNEKTEIYDKEILNTLQTLESNKSTIEKYKSSISKESLIPQFDNLTKEDKTTVIVKGVSIEQRSIPSTQSYESRNRKLLKTIYQISTKALTPNDSKISELKSNNLTELNDKLKKCKINIEKLLELDSCKEMKELRLSKPKPGEKGEQGIKGERGEKGDIGIQGMPGTCTKKLCQAENNTFDLKGDKGDSGVCKVNTCISKTGEKGNKGAIGRLGPKGDKGEMSAVDNDLIKFLLSTTLKSEIKDMTKDMKGNKGEEGVCTCDMERKPKLAKKPVDPFQENINIGYGSLVFEDRNSLEKVSFHLPLGSMAFLLKSDSFLVKVDHLNNVWRSIILESRSKDWILPGIQTTPKVEPQRPLYADMLAKKLHLVALPVATMGDLKSKSYQPGGYTGAAFQCQQNGDIYGYGKSMHPLINTDMFNMRFIMHDIYKYIPIYNSRGEILATDFQTLLSSKNELLNEILDFDRNQISENIISPCVWIGKDPLPEYRTYEENSELKCNNWMTRHPLNKGLVSMISPLKPMLSEENIKIVACSQQCHVLCIQTEPYVQ